MKNLDAVIQRLIKFRETRDWQQFHTPKNLALALSIEAAELNELFLWKKEDEEVNPERVKEELADVLSYAIYLSEHYGFDLVDIIDKKIDINELKYPVEKAKGSSKKYNEL